METKVRKQDTCKFVKEKLASNKNWAINALVKIFEFQTKEEQLSEETIETNGVGFTGVDAEILTSLAQHYISKGWLSPKQMNILYKKMPKYWMQIIKISDEDKLNLMVATALVN